MTLFEAVHEKLIHFEQTHGLAPNALWFSDDVWLKLRDEFGALLGFDILGPHHDAMKFEGLEVLLVQGSNIIKVGFAI